MIYHSLFNILLWAFVFHFAALSERKVPPFLIREVSSPPMENVHERVLELRDSGTLRVSTSWRGLCFAEP